MIHQLNKFDAITVIQYTISLQKKCIRWFCDAKFCCTAKKEILHLNWVVELISNQKSAILMIFASSLNWICLTVRCGFTNWSYTDVIWTNAPLYQLGIVNYGPRQTKPNRTESFAYGSRGSTWTRRHCTNAWNIFWCIFNLMYVARFVL